jgi:hypothetical protein
MAGLACPLSAISDHLHRSKRPRYSITSSARASSVGKRRNSASDVTFPQRVHLNAARP